MKDQCPLQIYMQPLEKIEPCYLGKEKELTPEQKRRFFYSGQAVLIRDHSNEVVVKPKRKKFRQTVKIDMSGSNLSSLQDKGNVSQMMKRMLDKKKTQVLKPNIRDSMRLSKDISSSFNFNQLQQPKISTKMTQILTESNKNDFYKTQQIPQFSNTFMNNKYENYSLSSQSRSKSS